METKIEKKIDKKYWIHFFHEIDYITKINILVVPWLKNDCYVYLIRKRCKQCQNLSYLSTLIKYHGMIYCKLNIRIYKDMLI